MLFFIGRHDVVKGDTLGHIGVNAHTQMRLFSHFRLSFNFLSFSHGLLRFRSRSLLLRFRRCGWSSARLDHERQGDRQCDYQ